VTNVSDGDEAVKGVSDSAGRVASTGAELPDVARLPLGRAAVEISKLLVEVLQVGHVGRRGGPDAGTPDAVTPHGAEAVAGGIPAHPGQISSHVIRAAIHIYGNGPQTIGQLATGLGVSQGWASRLVDEMERAGYVARERDPGDRRVVRVSLVPAAVERVEKAYRWRGDAVEAALEGMTPRERAAVAAFLRRFVDEVRASAGRG
jgi:DNA-binding MarR family transcriptional regulator